MTTPASDATTATPARSHLRETSDVKRNERIYPASADQRRSASAMHHIGPARDRAERPHSGRVHCATIGTTSGCPVRLLDVLRERATCVRPSEHIAATR